MKKLIVITIIAISIISTDPVFAQYSGGSGTQTDPWQIATANDLLYLAEHTEDYNLHFILTADINLADFTFTTAVIAPDTDSIQGDFQGTVFTGTFDGNDHLICNLTIDTNSGDDFLGLFGKIGPKGQIKNLGIEDVNVTSIEDHPSWCIGGLVGYNDGIINNCYSTGVVSGRDFTEILGGLVGKNYYGIISNCYSTCSVNGLKYLGGLVGENHMGEINNCYAKGAVAGGSNSGPLGGLVGENRSAGIISNCYSTGTVTGSGVGGLVAINGGTVSNCFWDIETSNCNTSAGGIGEKTAEMQTKSTFTNAGWDFVGEVANGSENIWTIKEGVDYPELV